ncbi:MAG: hypothetical protein K6T85_10740 [Gorillibacterium sp.]|nr:hypothetical protein [Gorillibacterium sp.]
MAESEAAGQQRRHLKRLLVTLASLIVLAVLLAVATVWYVRPTQTLDLNYQEVDFQKKVESIILSRSLTVSLTDEELSNLLKRELSLDAEPNPHTQITGARFQRQGSELTAELTVLLRDKLPAQVRLVYQLEWNSPTLKLQFVNASVKGKDIPSSWLKLGDIYTNIDEKLPPFVTIASVDFAGNDILFKLGINK